MLISYKRPSNIAWSLIGDGSAWLSDDAGAALVDGRPASVSRLQWLSGTQTTGSVLILRGTWGTALVPRVLALLGVTLPVGTLVSLAFRRPADEDYSYLADTYSQRVVELPDGSRCAWFVLPADLDGVIGVEYRLTNDVDGSAAIDAEASIDIGEVWVGPAVEILHERDWSVQVNDPSQVRRSRGGQVFVAPLRPWRTLQVSYARGKLAQVRGSALANGMDWQQVEAALSGAQQCAVVPRFDTAVELHRTALFAVARPGAIVHLAGPDYGSSAGFDEVPAAAP